jgi:tetratricopeptide (TPR) repeat protein
MHNWPTERLLSLPSRRSETWQGKLVRFPAWVTGEQGELYRPHIPFWLAVTDDFVGPVGLIRPGQDTTDKMIEAFFRFAMDSEFGGYRPGTVEVSDAALAKRLQEILADCDVIIRLVDKLQELERAEEELRSHQRGDSPAPPSLLDSRGVTLDQARRFAQAAADFYEAKLWLLLGDIDLIRIHTPNPPRAMAYASILGAARSTYGIGFFADAEECFRLHRGDFDLTREPLSSLIFGPINKTLGDDCDLWLDHDFPVAHPQAYPAIARYQASKVTRPSAKELVFVEGLLRALASTTENEIDGGQWAKTVETADGEQRYSLSIPDLVKPPTRQEWLARGFTPDRRVHEQVFTAMDRFFEENPAQSIEEMNQMLERHFTGKTPEEFAVEPKTPAEVAQALCYEALDTFGRRRVQLAKRALETDPECVEASVILAEQAASLEAQLGHYTTAMEAAERSLGLSAFKEHFGHFWGVTSTRPYMRARFGLAQTLEELGRLDDAVGHYQELLRLNPNDNQGVRYVLLPRLLQTDRDQEAAKLIKAYDEMSAIWAYSQAFLAFRLSGRSAASRRELRTAFQVNQHVPDMLPEVLESGTPPHVPDHYSPGSDEEAILCLMDLLPVFTATPDSIDWINDEYRQWQKERPKKPKRQLRAGRKSKQTKRRPNSRKK